MDRDSLRRKPYYAHTPEAASRAAWYSFGEAPEVETLFDYYANVYLPTIAHQSESWRNQVGWAMDKYILPALGAEPIKEIRRPTMQAHFNRMIARKEPQSISSVRRIRIVVSAVFNLAIADELLGANPCKIRLPKAPEPQKKVLTFAQLGKLLSVAPDGLKAPLLLCGCVGGLRIGEACAVELKHFEPDGLLFIDQQVLQEKGGAKITSTLKTDHTRRRIPLSPELERTLREIPRVSDIFLCSNDRGGYKLPNNVTRDLAEACKLAEIPIISPHELRHTFISLMENELEAPPAVVAALAGKKDKRVTSDYSKTFIAQKRKWLGRYFEEVQKAAIGEESAAQIA